MLNDERRQACRRIGIACAFLYSSFIVHYSSFLFADSIWVSTGGKNALELPGVKINEIREGKLFFVGGSGREASRELSQVMRVQADDDPTLTAAENAFVNSRWDAATDGYRKVLASSPKPWAKSWSAQRLVDSAQKANR